MRNTIELDGEWQFWSDPEELLTHDALPVQAARTLRVPQPWQAAFDDLRFFSGTAWYACSFSLPETWLAGQFLFLLFGAVDDRADIWLNGLYVGGHTGGYLPFEMDATLQARAGENTLVVRVQDDWGQFPEIPHGKQSWYGPLSGIWQPVRLEARAPVHIQKMAIRQQVTPGIGQVAAEVTLSQPLPPEMQLNFTLLDPEGAVCAVHQTRDTQVAFQVPDPQLWDLDTPNRYTLQVQILGGKALDAAAERFGFRTIAARDGKLWLNGRPLYLRGALDQDYYPHTIATPPSMAFIEDQFRKAKQMGLNCLRIHIKVGDPRYYEAADRMGLLIWSELPNFQMLTETSRTRAWETIAGMVARDGNRPSIIIWSIINESWGVDLSNPEHRAWLAQTYQQLKALDPTRLVVGNSACYGNSQVVTDIADFHNYYAMPDHHARWRDWVAQYAGRPGWLFAREYPGYAGWRVFLADFWRADPPAPAPEVIEQGNEPLLVSEFGTWGLPDVGQLLDGYGGEEPWWFETGLDWGEGVVYPHGVQDRFDRYHLARAFPDLAAFTRAAQELQAEALKFQIQQVRRHNTIQGYVITEFTDVHWECNGLLDMHRNPKQIFNTAAAFNADDQVLPLWDRLAYYSGEQCRIPVSISHYGPGTLAGSRVVWELEGFPALQGAFAAAEIQAGQALDVGAVAFAVPDVAGWVVAQLRLRWETGDGQVLNAVHQPLYIRGRNARTARPLRVFAPDLDPEMLPEGAQSAAAVAESDLVVAAVLDDAARDHLLAGGDVLWLADQDGARQTYLPGVDVRPRRGTPWQGDWATSVSWINPDRIFHNTPPGSLVGFAYADLTPEHVIVGLRAHEFAVDVHAALCVGWLHKAAALVAARRVGRGRLLITTFRLRPHLGRHPVADALFLDLLNYFVGENRR